MEEQYHHSYTILELKPGADWGELRAAYRLLVKKWHPDRFQLDGERRNAEEQTKEITRAYKALADFYRQHGRMPAIPATSDRSAWTEAPIDQQPEPVETPPPPVDTPVHPDSSPTPRKPVGFQGIVAVVVAVGLIYLWVLEKPTGSDSLNEMLSESPNHEQVPTAPTVSNEAPVSGPYFTRGSKIGDVVAIQGVPTGTDDGVWHYGKSKVYIVDGRVERWESHSQNPLRAIESTTSTETTRNFITRGSTMAEVLALQGPPQRQTGTEWVYGTSRIFFAEGLVTGWEESPFHPLKTGR